MLQIRPAVQADIAAITEIYAHHVRHGLASFEEIPPGQDEMTRRFGELQASGMPYLAAEKSGRIVGYAYANAYRTRPAYRYTVEDSVYITPDCARLGIGRALLAPLIAAAEAMGKRQMVAVIGDSANHASIGLHAALGFAQVGLLPSVGFKFGRWVDSVLMQRPLGTGDRTLPTA